MKQSYYFSILFANPQGIVVRVALLLERRGFTIESLLIKKPSELKYSQMKLVINGPKEKIEQVQEQLKKLIDVVVVERGKQTIFYDKVNKEDFNYVL